MEDTKVLGLLDKFKKLREEKARWLAEKRAAKYRRVNIEDLTRQMHRVGKIELPFPTLFAYDQIEKYFGDLEKIDLSKAQHVAAVVFFLKNGSRAEIAGWHKTQLESAISKQMTCIKAHELVEYVECINQIFLALQKKTLRMQRQMLEKLLQTILAEQPPGASS
jgi:hypothetical protein